MDQFGFLNKFRLLLEKSTLVGLMVGVLVFLGVVLTRNAGWLEPIELAAYDRLIHFCMKVSDSQSQVSVVTINESEIQLMGHWPLTDAELATVLRTVASYGAMAIGVDIYRDVPVPPGSDDLTAFLSENHHVVFPMKCRTAGEIGIQPPAVLKHTNQIGFVDMVVDRDGFVRRGLLFLDDGQTYYHSLSLRLALLYLESHGVLPQPDPANPDYLRLGPNVIPPFQSEDGGYIHADARGYQFLLDFRCQSEALPMISLTDLLSGNVNADALRDKVILIGVTAESISDYFSTPLSHGIRFGHKTPGVALHALSALQLIQIGLGKGTPIRTAISWQYNLWILLWGIAGGVIGARLQTIWWIGLLAIVGIFSQTFTVYYALSRAMWIPWACPALSWFVALGFSIVYKLNQEKHRRRQLMRLFATHVSPEFAEIIWQERNQFVQHGRILPQKLTATVLFSDVACFSSTAETLSPDLLISWLNEMMSAMVQVVIDHHGVVNKFIGDSLMAVFGVPVPRYDDEIRQDAVHAVACALKMQDRLIRLNQRWQKAGLPTMIMRIGIFTGDLVTGSLGSVNRMEYSVIGDTVNVASRLESFEKESVQADPLSRPCRICIGDTTMRYTGEMFEMLPMGSVSLKGIQAPMSVYQVIGNKSDRFQNPPSALYDRDGS